MASPEGKYKMSDEDQESIKPEPAPFTCQCETCRPDMENVIYTIAILALGAAAVVAGTFLGKETIQAMEDYNFPVEYAGNEIAMSNFLAYGNVAAIFIPEGNNTDYRGTSTQTFLDFTTNLTSVIDSFNDICFILALNRTHLPSFAKVKGALVNGSKIMSMKTSVSTNRLTLMDASYTEVRSLGNYAKGECSSRKKIFSAKPGTPPASVTRVNCTKSIFPSYEIKKDMMQITGFDQVESSCADP